MIQIKEFSIIFLIICSIDRSYSQRCGETDSNRIVNGMTASPLSWPWMARLRINFRSSSGSMSSSLCGGSLINKRWVITAAHCVTMNGFQLNSINVTLGEHNVNVKEGTELYISVSEVKTQAYSASTFTNDIALLRLSQDIDFNRYTYLKTICLPTADTEFDSSGCMATGWGLTRAGGTPATILQQVKLPVLSDAYCQSVWRELFNPRTKTCAGYRQGGQDTCQGDSGGPLQCETSDGSWLLVGLTSFGVPCARPNSPSVFTKVSAFSSWIQDITMLN